MLAAIQLPDGQRLPAEGRGSSVEARLPETEVASEWQRHLPWQMLKNDNAFSAQNKSLSNFQLYVAHTHTHEQGKGREARG